MKISRFALTMSLSAAMMISSVAPAKSTPEQQIYAQMSAEQIGALMDQNAKMIELRAAELNDITSALAYAAETKLLVDEDITPIKKLLLAGAIAGGVSQVWNFRSKQYERKYFGDVVMDKGHALSREIHALIPNNSPLLNSEGLATASDLKMKEQIRNYFAFLSTAFSDEDLAKIATYYTSSYSVPKHEQAVQKLKVIYPEERLTKVLTKQMRLATRRLGLAIGSVAAAVGTWMAVSMRGPALDFATMKSPKYIEDFNGSAKAKEILKRLVVVRTTGSSNDVSQIVEDLGVASTALLADIGYYENQARELGNALAMQNP